MENREQEALRELGSARVGEIHCITIIGQIEGHMMLPPDTKTTKYEHIMPLLAAVEEAEDVRALLILLNTVGGDIEAGLCLAEMIAGMSKPTERRSRGRSFHRRAACRGGGPVVHRAERRRDDPSGAAHGRRDRRAADVRLHFAHQRSDRAVHHRSLAHHTGKVHRVYDAHRRADAGYRQRARRRGGRPKRAHRRARRALRRAQVFTPAHQKREVSLTSLF